MRNVVIGVVAAVLVLTLAWWFAFFSPAGEQLDALRTETAQLQTQSQTLQNQIAQLEAIRDREVEIQADLARLEELIPVDPGQATLVRQIQLAADAAGVVIDNLTFEDPSVVNGAPPSTDPAFVLGEIAATTTIEGGYFQIADFLRRIEVDVPRAALVTDLDLAEGPDGYPSLAGTIGITLFAQITPPPVAVAPGAAEDPAAGDAPAAGGAPDAGADAPDAASPPAAEGDVEVSMTEARS